jgi:hypothetical protein
VTSQDNQTIDKNVALNLQSPETILKLLNSQQYYDEESVTNHFGFCQCKIGVNDGETVLSKSKF